MKKNGGKAFFVRVFTNDTAVIPYEKWFRLHRDQEKGTGAAAQGEVRRAEVFYSCSGLPDSGEISAGDAAILFRNRVTGTGNCVLQTGVLKMQVCGRFWRNIRKKMDG